MLLSGQTSRTFTISPDLVEAAVPELFNYPRLQLTDPETEIVAWWKNRENTSYFIKISSNKGETVYSGFPGKEPINLDEVEHPITKNLISVDDPLNNLELLPTPYLHETLIQAIQHIAHQIKELRDITSIPFRILNNKLLLDVDRAFGKAGTKKLGTVVNLSDITEFKKIALQKVPGNKSEYLEKTLIQLGEKCSSMNDDLCNTCVSDGQLLCLRSLIGKTMRNPLLLAHKGIELSDIQGHLTINKIDLSVFGFAKLSHGSGALTARNDNGAILLSQVLGQIDKTTFDTVMIISPSVINEDLRERLKLLCGVFDKKLLVLDKPSLIKFLAFFEEQATFDKLDFAKIYKNSRTKPKRQGKLTYDA